jgi:hypothetical protein
MVTIKTRKTKAKIFAKSFLVLPEVINTKTNEKKFITTIV